MPNPRVSILSIGSEVLDGRVLDSNSNYISRLLTPKGFETTRILSCDDKVDEICSCIEFLQDKSEIILITGGLGPTSDDLTREAVAKYLNTELEVNPDAEEHVKNYCAKKDRPFEANQKQTLLPKGSKAITNSKGSAPGVLAEFAENKTIACFPGVPKELREMFEVSFLPFAIEKYSTASPEEELFFCTFGYPEAIVAQKIESLNLPEGLTISYRASFPFIHLVVRGEKKLIEQVNQPIIQELGKEKLISRDKSISMELALHNILSKKRCLISFAESCTGGQIGQIASSTPGCSAYFLGSAVTYSNEAKKELVGVLESSLEGYGAVSHQIAQEMAAGSKARFCSDISVSVTGIAGPDGGSEEKPVGTFFVGYASDTECESYKFHLPGDRDAVRTYAAYCALDVLRRKLLGFKVEAKEEES